MKRNRRSQTLALALAGSLGALAAHATERRFTYSYEPETMPRGALEFEQWVTLRTQRTPEGAVQQGNFTRWEFREELEYGVTDRYTVGLYLNTRAQSFRDFSQTPVDNSSSFEFTGISLENRYMVLNPAEHPVGLTLYLEPAYSGERAAIEQKIILGQRHGDWKWALNLIHETEWEEHFHQTEGEVEGALGLGRDLGHHWFAGLEARSHSTVPEYEAWESTALFVGPVVSYRQEKWWATLTILPQVYGANFDGNPDANRSLDLAHHERVNVRLIVGINF